MSKKFWQTEKFRRIDRIWQEKLRESGFIDVEDKNGKLKQNSANSYRSRISTVIESKQRYFELLGHIANEEQFRNDVERLIIELKSNGVRTNDICKILEEHGHRRHRNTVRKIIKYFEEKWNIRKK